MKKTAIYIGLGVILILGILVVLTVPLKSDQKISEFSFVFEKDNNIEELAIVPDYAIHTLNLNYSSKKDDFKTDGIIGGDFFDRFEQMAKIIEKGEIHGETDCKNEGILDLKVIRAENKKMQFIRIPCSLKENDKLTVFKKFFDDVVKLLKEDVY